MFSSYRSSPRSLRRQCLAATAVIVMTGLTACQVQGGNSNTADSGEGFPNKAVEITAPMSAGGSTDNITRAIAKAAEKPLGQPIVVVNKPGANGAVGGKEVLASPADGYRLVTMSQSLMAITPLIQTDPDAIQLDQMVDIAALSVEDYVLTVPASSPVQSVEDLVAAGPISYGTTGAGTGSQLAQALLFATAKAQATDVPFDGGSELVNALLGSQVDVGANQIAEAAPQIEAGKLRPIAVFSAERIDFLADVPTAREQGYDIVVNQRRWLAAPAGTPEETVAKLREVFSEAAKDPAYQEFLATSYIAPWDIAPDQIATEVKAAADQYSTLAQGLDVNFQS